MALLTTETLPGYLAKHLEKIGVFAADAALTATEIHGGNLNYAFCVRDEKGNDVFVKQAPDFIKAFGESAKLHRERLQLEVEAYTEWTSVLGAEVSSKFLPRIFYVDLENMVFVMEFLGSYQLLDKSLFEGVLSEAIPSQMGELLALAHTKTHSSLTGAERMEVLTKKFENRILRDIQLQYVFTKAFEESPRAAWLRADEAFMAELASIRNVYNGGNTGDLALLHGDLHPGSVMVCDSTGDFKIIDPEFCIYGPPGLDLGSLFSGYVLAYVNAAATRKNEQLPALRASIRKIWEMYSSKALESGLSSSLLEGIGEDAVGFAACEVARTSLGFAGVRGLPIADESVKAKAEEQAVGLAHRCVMGRKGKGVSLLLEELERFGTEATG